MFNFEIGSYEHFIFSVKLSIAFTAIVFGIYSLLILCKTLLARLPNSTEKVKALDKYIGTYKSSMEAYAKWTEILLVGTFVFWFKLAVKTLKKAKTK